jgi:prepilin-type N-terminal cleavage/methylation domain-containing protein
MKKKLPTSRRRLPIDFGEEAVCPIPVRDRGLRGFPPNPRATRITIKLNGHNGHNGSSLKSGDETFISARNNHHAKASPSPGGEGRGEGELNSSLITRHSSLRRKAFTLVELLVVLALLSLIVFALMAVFSGTQRAFRASLTQTDTLESGRAVMDLIGEDLEAMTPSYGVSNVFFSPNFQVNCPVNFMCNVNPTFIPPLYQPLIGSPDSAQRMNIIENIFILSKGNINGVPSWIATGYSINTNLPDGTLYPLYRFYMTTNLMAGNTGLTNLFTAFDKFQYTSNSWSHMMDGVVNLTMRCYDTNGMWMTNGYYNNPPIRRFPQNVTFLGSFGYTETSCFFYSNSVPASVQIVMGTLEDRTMAHAQALPAASQSNYLSNVAGNVHLFSSRVWIRNLDPTAYQ